MKKFRPSFRFIYFALRFSAFVLLTVLISCKSDTTTGPPVNPPQTGDSLLFSKDSLVLRSTTNSNMDYWFRTVPQDSCRIEFTGSTNCDSINAVPTASLLANNDTILLPGVGYVIFFSRSKVEINKTYNIHYPGDYNPFYTCFTLGIGNSVGSETKYIILKNIKIYKIKN